MRVALLLFALSVGFAQSSPTFEVASVKVAAANPSAVIKAARAASADPIRYQRRGVTLQDLLLEAYKLKPQQLLGPAWLASERYDINARIHGGATEEERAAMLQNLLAERFE